MSFNVKLIGMPLLSGVNPKADHPLGLGSPHLSQKEIFGKEKLQVSPAR